MTPVPATRGTRVVVLEPVENAVTLPAGFVDIDELVEQEERDPVVKQAIAAGRAAVAENYYSNEQPRKLAYYRLRCGWSQKELAARMGTSQSQIARLETGVGDPQVSTIARLASLFGESPEAVLAAVLCGAGKR